MSEVILGAKLGRLQARVERLAAFARLYARCPFCGGERQCERLCAHRSSRPHDHILIDDARRALYGEEVPRP